MSKVTKFLDKDPTDELREFLRSRIAPMAVEDTLRFNRLLDELDMSMDWYYSQNELNKGRLRRAEADLQLRYSRFWAGVSAVERVFSKIADAAREQRWAANTRERERMAELSHATDSRLLDRLRVVHTASKGKGDQGAFDVWNEVADILGEDERATTAHTESVRCNNCSESDKRLYQTRGNGLVCLRCIRANVDSRPEFARADGSDD